MRAIVYTYESDISKQLELELLKKLIAAGVEIDSENPDIVFTIGGDGTVLKAIHHYLELIDNIKFIGIHIGHLGYYTDWLPEELDELVDFVRNSNLQVESYPLLQACLNDLDSSKNLYALNEFTILNAKRTQHLNVIINGLFLESFRGTGVCVCTPTGSTAYSKSLGGALLYPNIEAFQMTEIASINNNVYRTIGSPLIFPKEQVLSLTSENWDGMVLTQDHLSFDISNVSSIELTLSDKKVRFIKREEALFWKRVKQHFL